MAKPFAAQRSFAISSVSDFGLRLSLSLESRRPFETIVSFDDRAFAFHW
jgi:hypothetical protein